MKTMYCTLDTETVGGAVAPTGMYNVGCVIHDCKGTIVATTSLLVMEHFDEIRNDDYAKKNFPLYQERLEDGMITSVATEDEAVELIRNLCRRYNVKYVQAYNSAFDFTKTKCRELLDEFEFIDIYLMALQTITHQKGYQKFCSKNNLHARNSTSKCATSVESVYAFISQNAEFEEEHTALNDALVETAIFVKCYNLHKAFTKNEHQFNCKENKCFPPMLDLD